MSNNVLTKPFKRLRLCSLECLVSSLQRSLGHLALSQLGLSCVWEMNFFLEQV